ncbi:MAG: hypothetical protein ACRCX7_09940 [Cetobacterium sp.]|uniref:hypothetical protein n=1 Tax=Cetobacterium sp. TaxID=2071632 RepID=UPI003F2AA0D0
MLNLGQKVIYKGIETKIIGVDKSDMAETPYAISYVDYERACSSGSRNIRYFRSCLGRFSCLDNAPNGYTWVTADDIKEIAKPKAIKVNLGNLMEVGKWFMELTGRKMFASRGLEFYKEFMNGVFEIMDSIWLVEMDDGSTIHYNTNKQMETPELHDRYEVLEYKKEDKGMRFEKEGFEFKGWKLGEEVMYEGEKTRIVGFDLSEIDGSVCVVDRHGWDYETSSCKTNVEDPVFIEGVKGKCYWALRRCLTKITPKTTKIYSFADLHGKKSACGNFFIEATPTLIKVFTKTANRDSVGVFQIGRTSKLNTLADLTNFGFELYELAEFELSDSTKNKFLGFGNKKVCKLASIGDVWFVRVYHDGKDGQYDTISLTKEDKINKAEFLVGEVK